ncbi:unnamed protein product [Urochloa decumbens]|uniref:DUF1618 domain-containing protein n=1 Tax=Urochloa decumbens TaxID=240449 RepID=A0ABC9C5X8_9POAL
MEVMLDRFVFRRDGGAKPSFPENETTAGADTCIGVPFRVSIDLAAPPAISRFYLEWPRGPKPEAGPRCHLVAAHRGCILFRLTSLVRSKTFPQHLLYPDDYFLYRPAAAADCPPSSSQPSLTRLPTWIRPKPEADPVKQEEKEAADPVPGEEKEAENKSESDSDDSDMAADMVPTKEMEWAERLIRKKHEEEMALGVDVDQGVIVRSSLLVENVGLLCEGDDFVVAELQLAKCIHRVSAELSLFRSNVAVVPFGSSCLCWVDYRRGMILLGDVMEQSPNKLSYVPFPPVPPTGREPMHRGVCATDAGSTLKFVDVVVANKEQRRPCDDNTFTIFTYTLKTMAEGGRMRWEKDTVAPMTAEELWGLEAPLPIPHEVPLFPIVSMEKPQVLHFLLSECTDYIDTVTLVTVDMDTRTVMSVRPYIKGEQELLHGEDADLAEARTSLLQPFLPAHFSNSLDLNTRYYMCVVYSC